MIENEEFDSSWIVHFASDKQDREYRKVQRGDKEDGKDLEGDRLKLEEIFGKENIIDLVECGLSFPGEIGSSMIFEEGEIRWSFFPTLNGKKYFSFKKIGTRYHTIIFKENSIFGYEGGLALGGILKKVRVKD